MEINLEWSGDNDVDDVDDDDDDDDVDDDDDKGCILQMGRFRVALSTSISKRG